MSRAFRSLTTVICLAAALLIQNAAAQNGQAKFGTWGVALDARDASVDPGDDFFRYANGAWLERTEIDADKTSAGVSSSLNDDVELQVRAIVEDAANSGDPAGRQVGDFWASWMDDAGIEKRAAAQLKPYLDQVAAIRTRDDLLKVFAETGYTTPVEVGIIPDPADPTRYVAFATQSGLGMPSRDYYLDEGEKYATFRKAYRDFVIKLQTLAGIADAEKKADAIIAIETALAKAHWPPEKRRDIKAIYNPMNRDQLMKLAPQFEWPTLLDRLGLGKVDTIIAAETTAIAEAGKLLESVPLETWKDYSAFHFIRNHAQYLSKAFDEAQFAFYGTTLRDVPEQRARWKRGVSLVNGFLGEEVGKLYVKRHYPPESSRQMSELIADLRGAFEERLKKLDWMDDPTRKQALDKLAAFDPRIGHPVKYIDYSPVKIDRTDLLGNVVRASEFAWKLRVDRLGKPVDRDLWEMTPQTINAYYNALMNQITFPAAILQPPFFDPNADRAVNYGAIGAIIGHEIGHGFDDVGRRFDASGKMRDWWTEESGKRFGDRAAKLGAQFAEYEPIPDVKINAKLTMGENLADLGGIEMAYAAYRRYVAREGEPKVVDGLTGDQRFFLGYAQAWRAKIREGRLREILLSDPHSPPEFRVNGIVRNVDAWYRAFDVKPDDRLYLAPEQRVSVW